ncbi:MAG: 4Fe-4S binding protein [Coriobacteriia bacterium]|nr:4Fe-4S binding protein [Coriobacteriia bacterium]MCL2749922.1 4Fe-4S binding protein [Coriobacteriia bacterium]
MKKKKKGFEFWYLLALGVTGLIAVYYGLFVAKQPIDYKALIQESLPSATSVERVIGTKPVFEIQTPEGQYLAVIDSEYGYESTIEVLTIVNPQGILHGIIITKEAETPDFFERLHTKNFFSRFDDLSLHEPIYVGLAPRYTGYVGNIKTDNYVDVISGSTVSSHAIASAVNKGVLYLAESYFDTSWHNPFEVIRFDEKTLGMIILYLIALAAMWVKPLARFKFVFLLASIVLLGFMISQFITASLLFSLLQLEIPRYTNVIWYVMVFGSLAFIVFLGRNLYCSWLCPFGALQECLHKVTKFNPPGINPKVTKKLRLLPATLLWIAIILGTWHGNYATLNYQPFEAFFILSASWMMWIIMPTLLVVSLFYTRFFCTYLCPVGYVLNLVNRWRNKGVRRCKKWIKPQILWQKIKSRKEDPVTD